MSSFNPRARRGRDMSIVPFPVSTIGFNPRARRGRDAQLLYAACRRRGVSIHAPAGGAT